VETLAEIRAYLAVLGSSGDGLDLDAGQRRHGAFDFVQAIERQPGTIPLEILDQPLQALIVEVARFREWSLKDRQNTARERRLFHAVHSCHISYMAAHSSRLSGNTTGRRIRRAPVLRASPASRRR
jgi:hypothetical protein